ncbi:MAG: class I SAM-dependent methyltransferase [Pseudomonadota bacterium]
MTPTALRTAYDKAARSWGASVARLGYPAAYCALLKAFPTRPGGHVLDTGCGAGAFSRALVETMGQPDRLILMDPSQPMLNSATGALSGAPVSTVCAGIGTPRIAEASCDAVLCAHVIEHLPDPGAAICWLLERLKPGRPLYLAVSHPHWCSTLLRWKWGHRAFREDEVLAMLHRAGGTRVRSFRFPAGPPSRTSRGYVAFRSREAPDRLKPQSR